MSAFTALAAPSLVCYFGYRMLNFLFGWSDRTWLKSRKPKCESYLERVFLAGKTDRSVTTD